MSDRLSPLLRLARPARADRDLLRAYLAGEPGAFDELTRRHAPLARRVAALLLVCMACGVSFRDHGQEMREGFEAARRDHEVFKALGSPANQPAP